VSFSVSILLMCSLFQVDGTCYGVEDGDVNIQLKVKPCDKMVDTVYSTSGYKVATNVMVMEILPMNEPVSEGMTCFYNALLNILDKKSV